MSFSPKTVSSMCSSAPALFYKQRCVLGLKLLLFNRSSKNRHIAAHDFSHNHADIYHTISAVPPSQTVLGGGT